MFLLPRARWQDFLANNNNLKAKDASGKISKRFVLLYGYEYFLYIYVCACAGANRNQKRMSSLLELALKGR